MITLRFLNNIYGDICGALSDELITAIDKATSFYVQGYRFSSKYRARQWDGKRHLLLRPSNRFPLGIIDHIEKVLNKENIEYQIVGEPVPNISYKEVQFANEDTLRDYQEEAVQDALEAKRGILKMATNSGKTHVYAGLIQSIAQPTLFIAHKKDSMYQTQKNLQKLLGIQVGIVGDGHDEIRGVTVGMPQSLINNKDYLKKNYFPKIKLLIVNECHHLGAGGLYNLCMSINAPYRFGGSGTPIGRSDKKDMLIRAALGPIITEVSNRELLEKGVSSPCDIYMVRIAQPDWTGIKADYSDVYDSLVVENEHRNNIVCQMAAQFANEGKQVLIITRRVPHGKLLYDKLLKYNLSVEYISGKSTSDVRIDTLERFNNKQFKILIATVILDEDIDLKCVDVLLIAVGGKSYIRTIQRIGRGLRKEGPSSKLLVIDFVDITHKFLLEHSLERIKDYKKEECFGLHWDFTK